jgi:ribose transport system substrate-binding protein
LKVDELHIDVIAYNPDPPTGEEEVMEGKRSRRSLWALLVVLFALAIAVAACGDDDDEEESATAGGASTAAETQAAGDDCTGSAQEVVDKYRAEVPLKLPEEPLDLSKVEGKNFFFVSVVNNEFVLAVLKGYEEAVEAMGGKATVYDAKGQAARFPDGVQQAIQQNADGIILFGIAPEIVSKQLAEAEAKGIPVIDIYNGQPDAPVEGAIQAHVSADFAAGAEALANWMLVDSGCKANTVLFHAEVLPLYTPLVEDEPKIFEEKCPDDCSFEAQNIDLATVATKLGPQASSYVRANPDTNYVQAAFDSQITFLEPALSSQDVKILGFDGIPSVLKAIEEDSGPVKATMAQAPEKWIGYNIADALGRAIAEQEPLDYTIPARLVDKTNVGSGVADVWAPYDGFEEKWQAAWEGGAGG